VFVVVEGPDGAGKSTLVRWLAAELGAAGREVVTVREPGGTPVAEAVRAIVLGTEGMSPSAELFLMLAARADLVARVVRPALDAGRVVLADRYELSTFVYQVAASGLPRTDVEIANRLATGGLVPDITLVLDVPVALGRDRQRRAGKTRDRFERRGDRFQERVHQAYREAQGPGVVHLDASRSPGALQDAAWREVAAVALSPREVS
jgi:dTMP kinase